MGNGSFLGSKRAGRGVDHPTPSMAEVKKKSKGMPLLPFWAFVVCSSLNFTITVTVYLYICIYRVVGK
jgi:hypothetical protein